MQLSIKRLWPGLITLISVVGFGLWWNHRPSADASLLKDQSQASTPPTEVPQVKHSAAVVPSRPAHARRPVVHAEAIALRQALESFPDSFQKAVGEGDQRFAQELMEAKMTAAVSPFSPTAFAALRPLLEQHDFLWQDRPLVFMYWGGCLEMGCDRSAFIARLRRADASSKMMELCLDSWAALLPLALHPATANEATVLAAKKPVLRCLAAAAEDDELADEMVRMQVQSFLGFLRLASGDAGAASAYEELLQAAPDLPPLRHFLPVQAR